MAKELIFEKDITLTSIPHTSGFNFSGPRVKATWENVYIDFTLTPIFLRRANEGTSFGNWPNNGMGTNMGAECYTKINSFNMENLPFMWEVDILGANVQYENYITNYANHKTAKAAPSVCAEYDPAPFIPYYENIGKTLTAHMKVYIKLGHGLAYKFINDTEMKATYGQVKDVVWDN